MTSSWNTHVPSDASPQTSTQTRIQATEYSGKTLLLPEQNFAYGLGSKPGTPMKNVMYNYYGNMAEEQIRKSYEDYFTEKSQVKKLVIKKTPHFKKLQEMRKSVAAAHETQEEKPLYKLRMFQDVPSKIKEQIKQFKTYKRKNNLIKKEGETDAANIAAQVQEEIKTNELKEAAAMP
ncbi:MAG: DUF4483 domain-containing protein [archaeon]|nr:DUF4483 domain-containing protein [archaeon]MCQ2818717.1 DUF4483 domain-containing protein [archaeon]